jgi:hypothetical protein
VDITGALDSVVDAIRDKDRVPKDVAMYIDAETRIPPLGQEEPAVLNECLVESEDHFARNDSDTVGCDGSTASDTVRGIA